MKDRIATLSLSRGQALHASIRVGRVFITWIRARIQQYGFSEGYDFEISSDLGSTQTGAFQIVSKPKVRYTLSLNMAKELAMVENNDLRLYDPVR